MIGPHQNRGSLLLLIMCLAAVMGIALAGFLGFSTRSVQLSNRAYAKEASLRLAEMGLERAIRSFNYNTFGSWTLSGNTATQAFSIASARYGTSGFSTTVNVRVDNYNAFILDSAWNNTTRYHIDQFVSYLGNWYRCNTEHSGQTPGGANWNTASGSAPAAWNSGAYNIGDIVYYSGAWYRCIQAHSNQAPPNTAYWSASPLLTNSWTSGGYNLNDVVYDRGTWYRCTTSHTSSQPPPDSTYWASADTATWSPSTLYNIDDYVAYGGVWYRCIAAHSNINPNNSTYWATKAPVIYAEGVVTLPDGTAQVKTQIRAVVAKASLFANAVAGANTVTFSSGGTVDSYDSSRGATLGTSSYNSTSTPYSAGSPNVGDSAIVAATGSSGNVVTVTSTNIKGYLAAPANTSSPFAPRYTVGASARVTNTAGTVSAPHPTASNVDLTRVLRSPYVPQFDIVTPNTGTFTALPSSTATLGTQNDTTWQTYYSASSVSYNDNRVYTVVGPVRIVVNSSFYHCLSGGAAQIIIANNNSAKLEMFIAGDFAIYRNGIDNLTRQPGRLAIYSTTTSPNPDLNSTTAFYGTVYLTNTSSRFTVVNSATFYGAILGNNLTFSASPTIHYDTALRYASLTGADSPCIITQWRELTDPAERAALP